MDALIKQLVEALVLSRLALDRVDAIPLNTVEIARVQEMAEAAIQAAIIYQLGRTLSESEERPESQLEVVMDHEFESASTIVDSGTSATKPALLEQIRQSMQSDLQYVSIEISGVVYSGWYRVLPDRQMELLTLNNIYREIRHESTPHEQARAMLTDFINLQIYRQPRPRTGDERT